VDCQEIDRIISQSIAEEQSLISHQVHSSTAVRAALNTTRGESSKLIHGPPIYSTIQELERDIAKAYVLGTLQHTYALQNARKWFFAYTAALARTLPIV
jgi:hypothetical protein